MIRKLILFLVVLATVSSCSKVPAGNVGIKVYLLGQDKGVDSEELPVGRYWIGWNEELYLFPTFQQNYVWTQDDREGSPDDESLTFQTKEGLQVGADIGISYHINPSKVNTIFQKYRKGVEEITDIYLRNHVRDAINSAASKMNVESVYGEGKTKLMDEVQALVSTDVSPIGIIIDKIYLIGSFRLPESVVTSLNTKIEATQRAIQRENEVREAEAEAKKQVAIARGQADSWLLKADAEAKANRLKAASITASLIEYEKWTRWDGKMPTVTGGNQLIDLRK